MSGRQLHVVLGTGPLGLAVVRHLAIRGDRVRTVTRSGRADLPGNVEILAANVAEAEGANGEHPVYSHLFQVWRKDPCRQSLPPER